MARYFFHLVDGTDVLLDPEGIEIPQEDLAKNALWQARSLIAGDAANGQINLRFAIEIRNEQNAVVLHLPFEDAVTVVR